MLPDGGICSILGLSDLPPERVRIPHETILNGSLAMLLVFQIIEAVHAIALVAELSVGEAVAVELQALRLGAIAWLSGPHPVRFQIECLSGDRNDGVVVYRFRRRRANWNGDLWSGSALEVTCGNHQQLSGGIVE